MFTPPKNSVSSSTNLHISVCDSTDVSTQNITISNVTTPKNTVFDRDSIVNALRNSQGQFSPVYNKRLDRFALEERIRAHSNKHIIGRNDDIELLNKDAKKLNHYLISKGFNLEQDATLFLNEEDAVTVIHEIINSQYGGRAREKFINENSARITIKVLTKHLSNKLDGMQYYQRLPNSTTLSLCTLEAVVIILENNKENPDTLFCQTIFPIGTNKLQTFLKENKEQLTKRVLVKNKMPFRRIVKENIDFELMRKEDSEIIKNYCENYDQCFEGLKAKGSLEESSKEFCEQNLAILFKKCSEVEKYLLDPIVNRYLNDYIDAYRAQMQDINYNGNIREYNYYWVRDNHLNYHSYYVPKVIPFRHFPTIGSPTAVAIKGCQDTQVNKAFVKYSDQSEPTQKLRNLLNESFSNNSIIKKEVIIKDLRELLQEDGHSMYVLQQFFTVYDTVKSIAIKKIVESIESYVFISQKKSPADPLQYTKKTKDSLEKYIKELEELVRNYENYAIAKYSSDYSHREFSNFFNNYANTIFKLFQILNNTDLKKIDKKAILGLFLEHDKEEAGDLLEWAIQQKKLEENSNSNGNKENINCSNLMSFSETYAMLEGDQRLKGLEYIRDVLIARRKSRMARTMDNITLDGNLSLKIKNPVYHAVIQVLVDLNRSFKDLIKVDISLLKESSERTNNISPTYEGYNNPDRIKNAIAILKTKLLSISSSQNDFEEKLSQLKNQAIGIECLSIRMMKLFMQWRSEDTFSSTVVNHLFQSEMEILNEKRMTNILLQVKKDLHGLCLVVKAMKPFHDDPNAEEIAAAKLEILNFANKLQEISTDIQYKNISPRMAFSQLMSSMEILLKNDMVKRLKENVVNLEKLVLEKKLKKAERGINGKSLTLALEAFCEKFTMLKNEQLLLTSNMVLDPIDIFHNRFEIFNAEINALKISRAEVQFNHLLDKSLEMMHMFEQGLAIYEQGKCLDNGIERRDLSIQALQNNPITTLYASFVCRNGNAISSCNLSETNVLTVKM